MSHLDEMIRRFNAIPNPAVIPVTPEAFQVYRQVQLSLRPHVHMLFKPLWRSGHTVNGVRHH